MYFYVIILHKKILSHIKYNYNISNTTTSFIYVPSRWPYVILYRITNMNEKPRNGLKAPNNKIDTIS